MIIKKFLKLILLNSIFLILLFFIEKEAVAGNVIISEVAWMGTTDSANNEWIELYNQISSPVDLNGWVLRLTDGKIKITLKNRIPANGFYLLERTDDNSVSGIKADFIYTGALNNSGGHLQLLNNQNNIVDEANFLEKWPAGNNTTKQTMEKTSFGWQTSEKPNGTPKAKNSSGAIINFFPSAKSAVNQSYEKGILFNEIMPFPKEPDEAGEWIEIYNSNNKEVNLAGWIIKDMKGSVKNYVFPTKTIIPANGYLVIKRSQSKITLNNDQDGLIIFSPDKKETDSISYAKAPKNQSYNKTGSGWVWSANSTPGMINAEHRFNQENLNQGLSNTNKIDNKYLTSPADLTRNNTILKNNAWLPFILAVSIALLSAIVVILLKLKRQK